MVTLNLTHRAAKLIWELVLASDATFSFSFNMHMDSFGNNGKGIINILAPCMNLLLMPYVHDGTIGDFKGGLGAQAPLLKNELRKILRKH